METQPDKNKQLADEARTVLRRMVETNQFTTYNPFMDAADSDFERTTQILNNDVDYMRKPFGLESEDVPKISDGQILSAIGRARSERKDKKEYLMKEWMY